MSFRLNLSFNITFVLESPLILYVLIFHILGSSLHLSIYSQYGYTHSVIYSNDIDSTLPYQVQKDAPASPAAPKKLKYLLEPPVYAEVVGRRGENVTLPCILRTKPNHYKVKWTKLEPELVGPENIIMISNAHAFKPYGHLGPRASLRKAHAMDASLQLGLLELEDGGRYRCELVNGIEDESVVITLRIEGK